MSDQNPVDKDVSSSVLGPVDRASEMLFGLFMSLTVVGAVSVATAGRQEIRTMFAAALACNLGWGLVDAIMYLVRTFILRGHTLRLVQSVRATADAAAGRELIKAASPTIAGVVSTEEIEAIRERLLEPFPLPERPSLRGEDLLAALAICLIVVASTLPVVLPYVLIGDVGIAKTVSRAIALAMMFIGGLVLGRYAGYGSWKAGVIMVALGTGLVGAIIALGG